MGGRRTRPPVRPTAERTVTATATSHGYRLDGSKDRVEAGAQADLLLVTARADDGLPANS